MERQFIEYTLLKQISIAKVIQGIENGKYILFDKDFVKDKIVMIGHYRVDVDENGRRAVLSEGAQQVFDDDTYYSFVKTHLHVVRMGKVVFLEKK